MKKYYLAYGSNLNLSHMDYRCPSAIPIGTINLNNYRLIYKGIEDDFAYLTIEECNGYSVPLGLFEIEKSDIKYLDRYEGYPELYSKFYLPININGHNIQALIYIMNKGYKKHIPSQSYVETCIQGYDDFGFDKKILDQALLDTKEDLYKDSGRTN